MIKVTYHYSACIMIETPDVKILCDPWFSDGVYDGSWYHYPQYENPLSRVPQADIIYISHLHPDHFDPTFLKSYLKIYPEAEIVIADFPINFLSKIIMAHGFKYKIKNTFSIGDTEVKLFPNAIGDFPKDDVDSALVVKRGDHSFVNMNDNLFNPILIDQIKSFCPNPTIAGLTYTGAGPYPQTYFEVGPELVSEGEKKKQQFLNRYIKMRDALGAEVNIPFAGKYTLGSCLHHLNPYRGIADQIDVAALDPSAVVLADGGEAWINTQSLQPSNIRSKYYDGEEYTRFMKQIAQLPMPYEAILGGNEISHIPFERLLKKAYEKALVKSRCKNDHWLCFWIGDKWVSLNARKTANDFLVRENIDDIANRSEIFLDLRYLFGLLTHVYHWNNAQIGSHLTTRRYPNIHERTVPRFLDYLQV